MATVEELGVANVDRWPCRQAIVFCCLYFVWTTCFFFFSLRQVSCPTIGAGRGFPLPPSCNAEVLSNSRGSACSRAIAHHRRVGRMFAAAVHAGVLQLLCAFFSVFYSRLPLEERGC